MTNSPCAYAQSSLRTASRPRPNSRAKRRSRRPRIQAPRPHHGEEAPRLLKPGECPMRNASPPYGNFSESFHPAERNLSRERLKPFTSAPQTFRLPSRTYILSYRYDTPRKLLSIHETQVRHISPRQLGSAFPPSRASRALPDKHIRT